MLGGEGGRCGIHVFGSPRLKAGGGGGENEGKFGIQVLGSPRLNAGGGGGGNRGGAEGKGGRGGKGKGKEGKGEEGEFGNGNEGNGNRGKGGNGGKLKEERGGKGNPYGGKRGQKHLEEFKDDIAGSNISWRFLLPHKVAFRLDGLKLSAFML